MQNKTQVLMYYSHTNRGQSMNHTIQIETRLPLFAKKTKQLVV